MKEISNKKIEQFVTTYLNKSYISVVSFWKKKTALVIL